MQKEIVSIWIDKDLWRKLQRFAFEQEITVSSIIEELLLDYLENYENFFEKP